MLYPINLVIFDFDGVLVDSEYLSCKIAANLINEAGYKITAQELSEQYSGYVFKDILKDLEKKTECCFSANLLDKMRQNFIDAIPNELNIIKDATEAIKKINIEYCICSNSTTDDITLILKQLDIYDLFESKIFAAPDIGTKKLKPDPNVFLCAALKYKVEPQHCLVIEDSVPGILAAKKAGMRVVGFTGGSHTYQKHSNILSEAGSETVYADHSELPIIIKALQEWKDD